MVKDNASYRNSCRRLGDALKMQCFDPTEIKLVKMTIQESYDHFAQTVYKTSYLNWGLWDKKIYNEYKELNFDYSSVCNVQEINSQLLLYYLIRPLIKAQFFGKRLLDIGCGNGIGLKVSAELLRTQYALGIDLVSALVKNSSSNYYAHNKINFIQSDAESLPLENDSFDIITNLESSHLYPRVEHFFSEVQRVLCPGGFFCYSDVNDKSKQQAKKLDAFLKNNTKLKLIKATNITRLVQSSIYQRLIVNEDAFYNVVLSLFGSNENTFLEESTILAMVMGVSFLPWWKIRFKHPALSYIARSARKDKYWGKKNFFHYLIQKVS